MQDVIQHLQRTIEFHQERIEDAQLVHVAARAVREARIAANEVDAATRTRSDQGPGSILRSVARGHSPTSRRPAWRSAVESFGHTLVLVGQRLEHMGHDHR